MKVLVFLALLLANLPSAFSQSTQSPPTKLTEPAANQEKAPSNRINPGFPFSQAEFSKSPKYVYDTDFLRVSNYGTQGVVILGLGDEFNGQIASFSVCNIWAIPSESGSVNWGDGTPPTPLYFGPAWQNTAGTIKIPQQLGVFTVTVTVNATCGDNWQHGNIYNSVSGKGTATVYQSIPITAFQLNCATGTPCGASVQGGQIISGVVITATASPSPGPGTLVRISTNGPGSTIPYMIQPSGVQTVSFDIPTTLVAAPTTLSVSVNSGGTTMTQTISITP